MPSRADDLRPSTAGHEHADGRQQHRAGAGPRRRQPVVQGPEGGGFGTVEREDEDRVERLVAVAAADDHD